MSQKLSSFGVLVDVPDLLSRAVGFGLVVGRVVGVTRDGHPLVDFARNEAGFLMARSVVPMSAEALASLAERRGEVLLAFEGDEVLRPIVAGVLQPSVSRPVGSDVNLDSAQSGAVVVDGKRIRLEGKDEIVLSCGEASITLRRNGRVIIRGTHLESDSLGVNWIRGADIQVG